MNAVEQFKASARRSEDRRMADEKRRAREWALERGLEETFPASDPVAILQPSIATGAGEL
jgi:hypothetical protein